MADLQTLESALRKADAAGDTAAAQRLAQAIRSAREGMSHQSSGSAKPKERTIPTGEGMLRGAFQSATLGAGDEIVAGAAAALHPLFKPEDGSTLGQRYDAYLGGEREKLDRFRDESGGAALASELGGAVPLALALPGAGGSGFLSTAGRGAAIGGAEAAGYGFLTGEGGAQERGVNAAQTAPVGAVAGAAAPFVSEGIRRTSSALAAPFAARMGFGAETRANRYLGKTLDRSGKTAADIDAEIRQAAIEGQPEFMVADALGGAGQRALGSAARQPNDLQEEIVNYLNSRQDGQAERVGGFTRDAFGFNKPPRATGTDIIPEGYVFRESPSQVLSRPQISAEDTSRRLREARGNVADKDYELARENAAPVDVRGALRAIDKRLSPMEGSGVVGDGIDAKMARFRARLAAPESALKPGETARELSDFNRVLSVKQNVQDEIGAAIRAGRNNEARELKALEKELDAALEAASEGYRAANDKFREATRVIDSVDAGAEMARPSVRAVDNANRAASMTPDQMAAARIGYGDRLLSKVEASPPGVNVARPFTTPKVDADVSTFAVNPELLKRRIGREDTMFETRRKAVGGSETAGRLAEDAESSGANAVGLAVDAASTGGAVTVARQLARQIGATVTGKDGKTLTLIARALLSKDPQQAFQPVLAQAAKDKRTAEIVETLLRGGAIRTQ